MVDEAIVIVGSGPTGAIAAWTLVNSGFNVIMLESGNSFPKGLHFRWRNKDIKRAFPNTIWNHVTYPHHENNGDVFTRWIKAHLWGGLGNFWGGVVLRFAPEDFTIGETISDFFRWPISYAELEPFYNQIEQIMGVRGGQISVPVLPACQISQLRKLPKDLSELADAALQMDRWLMPLNDVYGKATILSRIPSPFNIGVRIIQQLQKRKNFRLLSNTHVTRLLFHKNNGLASGLEYINRETGELCMQQAKVVMLAGGQLGSTHILLNSYAADSTPGLVNEHELIGNYLHDNTIGIYTYKVDRPFSELNYLTGGAYLTRKKYSQESPLESNGFQVYGGIPKEQFSNLRTDFRYTPQNLDSESCRLIFACYGTQTPVKSRYVSLHPNAKDEYGLPLLVITTHNNPDDVALQEEGRCNAETLLKIANWTFIPEKSGSEPPGTSVHFGGTARMHHNPKFGVVDAYNRMHEVQNVLVIDASCFTTSVEKNPTLTAMAIAMRAAHHLSLEK
jgi:choline dehydrogenase-like flavoprotein